MIKWSSFLQIFWSLPQFIRTNWISSHCALGKYCCCSLWPPGGYDCGHHYQCSKLPVAVHTSDQWSVKQQHYTDKQPLCHTPKIKFDELTGIWRKNSIIVNKWIDRYQMKSIIKSDKLNSRSQKKKKDLEKLF